MGTGNRRRDWELESILETVLVQGFVVIPRYRLPTLLSRERERGEIWNSIIDIYDELGGDKKELRGKRVGDSVIITRFNLDTNPYDLDDNIFNPRAVK